MPHERIMSVPRGIHSGMSRWQNVRSPVARLSFLGKSWTTISVASCFSSSGFHASCHSLNLSGLQVGTTTAHFPPANCFPPLVDMRLNRFVLEEPVVGSFPHGNTLVRREREHFEHHSLPLLLRGSGGNEV